MHAASELTVERATRVVSMSPELTCPCGLPQIYMFSAVKQGDLGQKALRLTRPSECCQKFKQVEGIYLSIKVEVLPACFNHHTSL